MMEDMKKNNKQQFWSSLYNTEELPELSLAPTTTTQQRRVAIDKSVSSSSSAESETTNSSRKRKLFSNNNSHLFKSCTEQHEITTTTTNHASVDLHLKDRLPLDWEQCLDLQSGRMYYLNRRTLRKSWEWPKDHHHHHQQQHQNNNHKLDLELNISPLPSSTYYSEDHRSSNYSKSLIGDTKTMNCSSSSGSCNSNSNKNNSNMVALACLNCHLLVIFSKSSPSCPNCKYVHSIPTQQQHDVLVSSSSPVLQRNTDVKPLHTLSLLN